MDNNHFIFNTTETKQSTRQLSLIEVQFIDSAKPLTMMVEYSMENVWIQREAQMW